MSVNAQYLRDLLVDEFLSEPISPMLLREITNRAHQLLEKWKNEGSIEPLQYILICDESNNPPESIQSGFLNIDVRPPDWWVEQERERLSQWTNGDSDGPEAERFTTT
jgi:hypothetical protein